jgi:hypothetical protein
MARHLSEDALWREVEGDAEAAARAHLLVCAECRRRVQEAKAGLELARGTKDVPEPSPLYWEAFRRQLRRRIAEEPAESRWSTWRRRGLSSLVPVTAVALLLALVPSWRKGTPDPERPLPAWEALPPTAEDPSLDVLRGLAYEGNDLEAASGCRDVVECVGGLSEEESRGLVDALRGGLPEGRS